LVGGVTVRGEDEPSPGESPAARQRHGREIKREHQAPKKKEHQQKSPAHLRVPTRKTQSVQGQELPGTNPPTSRTGNEEKGSGGLSLKS